MTASGPHAQLVERLRIVADVIGGKAEWEPIPAGDLSDTLREAAAALERVEPQPQGAQATPARELQKMRDDLRGVAADLITLSAHPALNEPYSDDPRWTPWTRWGERALRTVGDVRDRLAALAAQPPEPPPQENQHRADREAELLALVDEQRDEHLEKLMAAEARAVIADHYRQALEQIAASHYSGYGSINSTTLGRVRGIARAALAGGGEGTT